MGPRIKTDMQTSFPVRIVSFIGAHLINCTFDGSVKDVGCFGNVKQFSVFLVPATRVPLMKLEGEEYSEYINANYTRVRICELNFQVQRQYHIEFHFAYV